MKNKVMLMAFKCLFYAEVSIMESYVFELKYDNVFYVLSQKRHTTPFIEVIIQRESCFSAED